ncbi:hypothetical protein [Piscinibacter sp. XHJ-5]|uniref:hypothetical protein n=1 Tax=Piscinibacter sp. XHJ-5 TaxID=3037797 RepID=UPI0024528BA3|nr:hypothetical protein [Piscinibacter sp. XHJ-5]
MAQHKQGSGKGSSPSKDQAASQRKPNLSQGAGAMSQRPDAAGKQQRKPNLDQGAGAMSPRPDADIGSEIDKDAEDTRDQRGRS